MKRLLLILLLLLVPASVAQMPGQKPIQGTPINFGHHLSDGLVGMWLFNDNPWPSGTTYDLSGNGNHGTLVDHTKSVPGLHGNALDFDGTGDWINVGDNDSLDFGSGNFTISTWVKTTANGPDEIVSKRNGSNDAIGFIFSMGSTEVLVFEIDDGVGNEKVAVGTVDIHDGNLHHVVAKREGDTIYIYTDGGDEQTKDVSAVGTISNILDLRIGANNDGSRRWNGQIDMVSIYNRALAAAEVAELYAEPFAMFKQARLPIAAAAAPTGGGQVIIIMSTLSPYLVVIGTISILAGTLGYSTRKAA